MITAHHIAGICKGELNGTDHARVKNLITDSRIISAYDEAVFFALVSERNNGHRFINELYEKGVRCFVVSEETSLPGYDCALIKVKDTLVALQELAAYHRQQFKIPTIAITGSNGKTIVKEWLYQLLKHRYNICRSPKSYNSQIGVPLSVWNLNEQHNLAIFEAGISQTNEMQKLSEIICPTIGVFTGIGAAHQEGFKSQEEKIKEKLSLFTACDIVVVNGLTKDEIKNIPLNKKIIRIADDGEIQVKKIQMREGFTEISVNYNSSEYVFEIPFMDSASANNALSCFGLLVALELNVRDYLSLFKHLNPVALRLEIKTGINNCVLINDYYNSDVDSLKIALNALHQNKKSHSKTLILSDIEQSGRQSGDLYKEIALLLQQNQVEYLIGIGKNISANAIFFTCKKDFFESTNEFLEAFHSKKIQIHNSTVLLKGARRFGFEKISQLLQQKSHDTVLEINLNNLTHNINYYKSLIDSRVKIMCMVKAMGYGSGSNEIARVLQHTGINYLAVAYADEGVELRNSGIQLPIMVMSPEEDSMEDLINFNLEPEIYSFRVLDLFCRQLSKNGISESYPVHIKIDTGMHRLGFEKKEFEKLADTLLNHPQIKVQSVFSHLVASDNSDLDTFTKEQIDLFKNACGILENTLNYTFIKHICNSGGISRFKDAHFNMVRLGVGMYGIGVNAIEQSKLLNVGTLKTRISQIKKVSKGGTVGYNRNGKINRDTIIATIPIGYADGFRRDLGNGNFGVIIKGKVCKTIGNICMDMCMVDVSEVNCKEGDEAVIFENFEQIQKMAKTLNTIPYEVLTSISTRVKRIYVQE